MTGDWDPAPHERSYYRHITTGDLGWMVRRDGKDWIRLDRGAAEELRAWRKFDWVEERSYRQLSPAHIARIAFEADRSLCSAMGMQDKARHGWLDLSDEKRQIWMSEGPKKPELRAKLYAAIKAAMEGQCLPG